MSGGVHVLGATRLVALQMLSEMTLASVLVASGSGMFGLGLKV
jgi:hypothetical protein